jgi:hypothetical protein
MSNTSRVSPYDSSAVAVNAGSAVGSAVGSGLAALIGWLSEETAEDRAVTARRQSQERRERLSAMQMRQTACVTSPKPIALRTIPLKLKQTESLVRSAEKLGYHVVPLAGPLAPLAHAGTVLLRHTDGRRLALRRSSNGRIQVETTGEQTGVDRLVHQHTSDQASALFAKQGMEIQTVPLGNGESQILASEPGMKPDGSAVVRVQVRSDGKLDVDVDCVRGGRCQRMVDQLAEAIGGEVTATTKKATYFEEPGEPTRTRVKV